MVMLCIIFTSSSCKYTKGEEVNISTDETYVENSKEYFDDEVEEIYKEGKYPSEYIKSLGETFQTKYFNGGKANTNFNITVKNARVLDNVNGLDKNDFLDFDEDVQVCLSKSGKFKTYNRKEYTVINGGLDIEVLGEEEAQSEIVLVDVEYENSSEYECEITITPALRFEKYKKFDDEFVKRVGEVVQYESVDGKYFFSDGPIYFPQSQYKNSNNQITRAKKFFVYKFKEHETLNCTLGFVIDKDLEDDMYLSFIKGQFDELVKVF